MIEYLGQSSGQGKMAAYPVIHVRGILNCLHVDSQKHQPLPWASRLPVVFQWQSSVPGT